MSKFYIPDDVPEDDIEYVSRTELKRDAQALQDLGKQLAKLPQDTLKQWDLPDQLYNALVEAQHMKSNSATKRHFQYIGKLLRKIDVEPIKQRFEQLQQKHLADNRIFHELENWRDQIIEQGDEAITRFMETYYEADRARLRQLARNAKQEYLKNKPPKSARTLFKYLREVVELHEEY